VTTVFTATHHHQSFNKVFFDSMKILSWNCNLNLSKKFQYIESFEADVCLIQECEKLDEDYFPNAKFYWMGKIEKKGLGVIINDNSARISNSHNHSLINFLPIESDDLNVLAVWAYNHRAIKFGNELSGNTIDAINYYKDWLDNDYKACIFGGDFNNSPIWDKRNKPNNFSNINQELEKLGFKSSYHYLSKDTFGKESKPTFFHTKNQLKSYHIDYLYLKNLLAKSLDIGNYNDWIKLSDHVPMIIDI